MITFYLAFTLATSPMSVSGQYQPYDSVQAACQAAKAAETVTVIRISYKESLVETCCKDLGYWFSDADAPKEIGKCEHEPDKYDCSRPSYSVQTVKCVSSPTWQVVDP